MTIKDLIEDMPRNSLLEFSYHQEKILKENDHKNHWSNYSLKHLLKRLHDEYGELKRKIDKYSVCVKDAIKIQKECADVANFAMMIYDNISEELDIEREG